MAWIFFLVFILISTFVVLNLFLAVIVNAMDSVRDAENDAQQASDTAAILGEIGALRQEIVALRDRLEPDSDPARRP